VRQTQSSKLSPQLGSALDELSLKTPHLEQCCKCGNTMLSTDAQFWFWGRDEHWTLKMPFCVNCDGEAIRSNFQGGVSTRPRVA
jgi:hypothetical protein